MAQAAPLVSERLCGDLQQPITALSWSADGEFLAIASAGGELLLLDFRAGCEELLRGERDGSLDVVGFSTDGQFLMAVGQDGELLVWELGGTGARPLAFEPMPLGGGWIDAAAWQPGGLLLALATGRTLRLWDGAARQWREPPAAMGSWCCGGRLRALLAIPRCATPSARPGSPWRFRRQGSIWPAGCWIAPCWCGPKKRVRRRCPRRLVAVAGVGAGARASATFFRQRLWLIRARRHRVVATGWNGWQRASRQSASQLPRQGPWISMAAIAS